MALKTINLRYEIDFFKHEQKFPQKRSLSLKNKKYYDFAIRKAYKDACGRKKGGYIKSLTSGIAAPLIDIFFDFFNNPISKTNSFSNAFNATIAESQSELGKIYLGISKNEREGRSQKLVTMAFKYFRCYEDADDQRFKNHFSDCYMPLDGYTLEWCKTFLSPCSKSLLKSIITENKWTVMPRTLFDSIQGEIKVYLSLPTKKPFKVTFSKSGLPSPVTLPTNSLEAEFFVWHQEKLNELHKLISKLHTDDLLRLGI